MWGCAGEQEEFKPDFNLKHNAFARVSEALLMLNIANGGIHCASTCFQYVHT